MTLLGTVVHVLDGPWREGLEGQGVVDSDGDPTGNTSLLTDHITDLCLKGKMTSLVFRHFHPIDPLAGRRLGGQTDFTAGMAT